MTTETIRCSDPKATQECYLQRGYLLCSAIRDKCGNPVYTLREKGKGPQGKVIKIILSQ